MIEPVRRKENTRNMPKWTKNSMKDTLKSGLGKTLPGIQVNIRVTIIHPTRNLE